MASDLISRAALLAEYDRVHVGEAGGARKLIAEAPAVDAEPVRHGEWVLTKLDATYSFFKCSECGRPVRCGNANFMKPSKHVDAHYPYCNCGAKMDGGKNETESAK